MGSEQVVQNVETAVSQELAAFRKHLTGLHLSFTGIVAVLVLTLGLFVWHGLNSYQKLLDKADARYAVLQDNVKALQTQLADDAKQRSANDKQVQVIVKEIASTNKQADDTIKKVTDPDRTQQQVADDSKSYLGVVPTITPDGLFGFHATSVQGFVATKIDNDRLTAIVAKESQETALERASKESAEANLAKTQQTLTEAQNSIKDYQHVAKKGKWAKVWDQTQKWGGLVAGIVIGRKL